MDEEVKKQVAVFRFRVIADFVDGTMLSRGETKKLMRQKCDRKWQIPGSGRTRISKSAIKEWKSTGERLLSGYFVPNRPDEYERVVIIRKIRPD